MGKRKIPPASAKPTEVPIDAGKTRCLRITGGLQRQSRGPERDALQKLIENGGINPLTNIHVFEQVHVQENSAPHTPSIQSPSQTELPSSTTTKPPEATNTANTGQGETNMAHHRKEIDDLFNSKAPANPSPSTPSGDACSYSPKYINQHSYDST